MRRILSIDGGGIKGVCPAAFLAVVETSLGKPIVDFFDLIVGTSTGGIIALGLGLGLTASDILRFYEEHGPLVFCGNRFIRGLRRLGYSKYNQDALRKALSTHFGERRLGESRTRLVIPSMNLETGEVHLFKTSHAPRFEHDYRERAVEVALATTAAPTYFPTHRTAAGTPLVDGGMWANNPVGVAVAEAIGVLGWPREDLRVLSLGCSSSPLDVGLARFLPSGLGYWATKLVDVLMAAQSSSALGTAQVVVGKANVIRINPVVPKGRFRLDDPREIDSLKGLGSAEARKALPELRPVFFQQAAETFEPYHRLDPR
ncbi:MAG: patatin-like phospholipase family protein [Candidatus Rokubacteria bacterium]|nr:patatin-like phospholipase family protein [Candidatus Rokubacteria bacterium]